MDLLTLIKHKPLIRRVNTVQADKLFILFKGLRFDLDLDLNFFRFCLFFFGQGDLQDSLIHLGNEFFRINLVVESKAPYKTLFSEFTDTIIVCIAFRTPFLIALEGQYAVMKLNQNVFLGHARGFCFQMKGVVLFNQIDLG
jgi:hypothetical protein